MEPKVNIRAISMDVIQKCLPIWMQYTVRNYETIKNALNEDKAFSIARLGGKHVGKPAVCIGSGPTLTPSLPYLKEWQEETGGLVYCGLSNINLLMSAGIKPSYFVIYDFRDTPDDPKMPLSTEPGFYDGIPMIIPPEYDPKMIKFWLGTGNPVYFVMRGAGGNPDTDPYISYLHRLLPAIFAQNEEIKPENRLFTGFINVGCVANQEIFCATVMGCDPIYLCGVNLGYPESKAHIKPMIYKDGDFTESEYMPDFKGELVKGQCYADNGILTDTINLMYKHATLFIWMSNRLDLYELTIDGLYGILDVLPKIDIKDLVSGKAVHIKVTMQERQKIMQKYRADHSYKEIKFGEGAFNIPEEDDGEVAGTDYYHAAEPIEGGVDPMTLK